MGEEYKPEYADGQILVRFLDKWGMNEGFMDTFLQSIGYKFKDQHEYILPEGDYVVVEVPVGEEDKACQDIKQHSKFVDWATRRDLKYERRSKNIEDILDTAKDLDSHSNLPTKEYNSKLDELKSLIEKYQEKE
jgi:hypothetical protein